ncbi:MAG TPA: LPS export ABC transporter periplasmic protein LptC [Candidatus Limnocylindria bacterium]|nr:LPS export ABC transporter periplasmic protein LptC [Candidatus Limnocylindria bacterium]
MPPVRLSPARSPAVLAVVGLLLLLAALSGCERARSLDPTSSNAELPDQEVSDFVLTETDGGRLEWKMFARGAATYSARNLIIARDVRVDFFDENGKRSSVLTAQEGEIHQLRRDMVARGNVVLQTTEGTRMSTQQLRFLNREQKIVSDEFVRVERSGDVLTGYGFESDPHLNHFEFKRRVQATVRTRSGGLMEPRGESR